jgi:gamma-glutamyltranspeptidase/glutathione hydrolase
VLWVLLLASPALAEPLPEGPGAVVAKSSSEGERYMAVTANPLASAAAEQVLSRGGSAVDATVAAQLVLNLVEPQSSGLGGGAFLVHYDARSGKIETIDGRETAPAAAKPDRFLASDGTPLPFREAVLGGRSVGVPGTLRLLEAAHARWGHLPWAELFEPAMEMAQQGFAISPRLAGAIGEAAEDGLEQFPATRAYFFDENGGPRPAGTILRNPEFVATLKVIAERGAGAFYDGSIGRTLVETSAGRRTRRYGMDSRRSTPTAAISNRRRQRCAIRCCSERCSFRSA